MGPEYASFKRQMTKANKLLFGPSKLIKDKASKRRISFLSVLCVIYEILFVVVTIIEPSLFSRMIAGILLMVICCIFLYTIIEKERANTKINN